MKFAYKMVCLLVLVLSASFGVGGCYLLYSDFSAQLARAEAANADTHRQVCTLLQGEILDRQRRGESLDDAALTELLANFALPTALWRDGVCIVGSGDLLPDGTMEVRRLADGGVQATYASSLQGGLQLATAYDLTDLYRGRDAALRRFLLLEAAVLAAGAAVTAVFARRMTRPLRTLTTASAEIADGDYARRTGLHTGDEIETLSSSFDKMADAVQEKITALQADVRQREDFMGAFAHELKTPMTSIIGYADMLRTIQASPAEQYEAAGAIYHEGRRLEALSGKLLALLGLGEETITLQPTALAALWPRLQAACPGVPLQLPACDAAVQADADLLLDLLCNLVGNAVKASEPGQPVEVRAADNGDTVTLTVADHGCGIPQSEISRVTEPFYMVDKSRARKQGGSGLGLALCKRIAEVHGSDLHIESTPGEGTRVSVILRKGAVQ
ncbi:MAG: HAMP domain-containing sensor histidine kinase [Subdoligranulum variabile]|uniref:sensor histidine kinase n=1 Tax=Gemmiger sp. TaxID=2049027 RepID=UPI0025F17F46|nr:HAMP domain-containing sensor histidine kinase [Gemmiger sp.]MBD8951045.1 sensor histidine kinase [Subdoligranulum sp.]MCI6384945.1 HAMP domain-containing histidine kinase [Subdoligranulum variabile]MBD8951696.1 sensor histidine kinase [Subdoligranulum sp.]MDD7639927.1 HAMP domain-containing sensor histidine kinase [Subdoligranulum variabile]MDY4772206.1 HAMP domain-containing sensor histidine kinase [Gemmiger sp.]